MESTTGSRHPDVVILDGAVWTGASGAPGVEAVALTGNRVSATGPNNEVRDLIGPGTEVISAGGNTVMPGIVATLTPCQLIVPWISLLSGWYPVSVAVTLR